MVTKVPPQITTFPDQLAPVGSVLAYLGATPPAVAAAAASITLTFGDTEFDDVNNGTLTLVSADGTSRIYKIKNDYGATVSVEFNAGASAAVCAANMKAAIEHAENHADKLTVTQLDGLLTITQVTSGDTGNTPVTSAASFDSACDVNPPAVFTSGRSDGWLYCDGATISRTTYAALFAQIGTVYGVGDGSTTFQLPDLRGRFLVGRDSMGAGTAAGRTTTGGHGIDAATLGATGAQVVASSESLSQAITVNFIIRADQDDS
tara:strand:- start:998 stop:1783 length:786 start_codon:yes stop_codon:yes gene_type:complete